jgi:PAS domain S-box-containing protein
MVKIRKLSVNKLLNTIRIKVSRHEDRKENKKFSPVIEFAPDAFIQGDYNGNVIAVNNKTIELSGYSRDELLQMNISDLLPENILKEKPLRFDLIKKGITVKSEREIITKSGKRIQVETNTNAMPDGTYQSFIRDITDRKIAEEVIRVSEARLNRAELASKSGNWELHLDTQMMVASEGATIIYGVDKDQMEYSIVKKVPLPEYRPMMDLALKELLEKDKPYDIEFKIKAVNSGEIKDIRSIAIFDKEKRILFGAIQDITRRKKIEEELIKAKEKAEESDRLKTAFLQNLSHEIRTPMNAIMGFSELMVEEFDNKIKLKKYADIINNRCNDLLAIINDILDIATIESGQLAVNAEECNIHTLFEELASIFVEFQNRLHKQHIKFNLKSFVEPSGNVILTDKVKLKQILINLINNAFKFTEAGTIEAGCKPVKDQNIQFYVKDTGIGIPSERQEEIFERFVQLDQIHSMHIGGNGLGLSIAKGLISLLEGEIFLESEPGRGSTFSFTIPYKIIQQTHIDASSTHNITNDSLSGRTVLIVEDDLYNTEYFKEILTGIGLKTLQAINGKEAITKSINQEVDLVLMDIRLPDINGYEATRQIKQKKPMLKIIAQTAYTSHNEKQKAINAGCDDYLSKPTKKYLLTAMIYKHLAKLI